MYSSSRSFHHHNPSLLVNQEYGNFEFKEKLSQALKVVETMIDNTRKATIASPNHTHTYDDKFNLSESMTNTAVTALLNVLEQMGLGIGSKMEVEGDSITITTTGTTTADALRKLTKIAQDDKKSITARFVAKESCSFVRESEFDFENPHSIVEEETTSNKRGKTSRTTKRVVKTKVKQYHWNIGIEYDMYVYCGNETLLDAPNTQPITTKAISYELITKTSEPPYSPSNEVKPLDVSLTWLLQNVNKETLQAAFSINRERESCRTPRNNDEICQAWDFFKNVANWSNTVGRYFIEKDRQIFKSRNVASEQMHDKKFLASINGNGIFVPVLPIFESSNHDHNNSNNSNTVDSMEVSSTSTSTLTSPLLPAEDVNRLLEKQYFTMSQQVKSLESKFSSQPFMSSAEAVIVLLTKHVSSIVDYWSDGINHLEDMLCTQLYNAIGKNLSSDDLNDFVRSHNQKLFVDTYAPEPFCHAVRRAGCFPDGTISIEETMIGGGGDNNNKHAMTFTRQLETSNGDYPMQVPINSATNVQLSGDLFLHAWMLQRFQGRPTSFQLVSRARQFSSFLLLIGKLTGPDTFEPEHAIILQNKDELLIPLLLEEMPSAKEFKDAISSLSPEQQRFAKAFRSMKLSSSVFGVGVVQLKPQLEILLNLPEKSLTKEIRLTQDLLSLFIDYQIPSDLLSYDGADDLDPSSKVDVVKGHVKKVLDMVDEMKDRDLKGARQEADMKFELALRDDSSDDDEYCEEMAEEEECMMDLFTAPRGGGKMLCRKMEASVPKKRHCRKAGSAPVPKPGSAPVPKPGQSNKDQGRTDSDRRDEGTLEANTGNQGSNSFDLTTIPKILDSKFEMFDENYGGALRSTIIKASENWTKKHQKNLLTKLESMNMSSDDQKVEGNKAFDLLDALSRSGDVPLKHSELHVIIASTHCFDKSVVNTVVQDNINPIEKIERSNLLVASQIHGININGLLSNIKDLERITKFCPMLSNH